MTSDPTEFDNERSGGDLLARIDELTDGVSGDGHSWRHLLLACKREILGLTNRADLLYEYHAKHDALHAKIETVKRLLKTRENMDAKELANTVLWIFGEENQRDKA